MLELTAKLGVGCGERDLNTYLTSEELSPGRSAVRWLVLPRVENNDLLEQHKARDLKLEQSAKEEIRFLAVVLSRSSHCSQFCMENNVKTGCEESFPGIRCCSGHLVGPHSLSLYHSPVKRVLLVSLSYRRGNRDRKVKRLSQLTSLVDGRVGVGVVPRPAWNLAGSHAREQMEALTAHL